MYFIINQTNTMPCTDIFKKIKNFGLFEPSIQILGFVFSTVLIACYFIYFNHGDFGKGLKITEQTQKFMGHKFHNGTGGGEKIIEYLSENGGSCDVFDGDWVWDERYPLYESKDCKFLDGGFRCSENGRPDLLYTKWRWQPKACNLPRFIHLNSSFFMQYKFSLLNVMFFFLNLFERRW